MYTYRDEKSGIEIVIDEDVVIAFDVGDGASITQVEKAIRLAKQEYRVRQGKIQLAKYKNNSK